jgi:cytochrome c oxidase subunit 2
MDSQTLEKTWTLLPMLVLLRIAYPRLHLLCLQDSMSLNPSSFVKVIRNQWNWQREVSSIQDHLLDSDKIDELRAFESPMPLAFGQVARILVTRRDVLHSLGLPSLGVKLDSAPGRLNATTVELRSLGLIVGSCYELCGSGHRAMPIYVLVI